LRKRRGDWHGGTNVQIKLLKRNFMAKDINVLDWLVERAILTDKSDRKANQNAIRWFKKNIDTANTLVCVKRGVYMADEAATKKGFAAYQEQCRRTAQKRRELMQELNSKKAQDEASSQKDGGSAESPVAPSGKPKRTTTGRQRSSTKSPTKPPSSEGGA
jgi:hypothetical protein